MEKLIPRFSLVLAIAFVLSSFEVRCQVQLNVEGLGSYQATLANFGVNNPCNLGIVIGDIRKINDGTLDNSACSAFADNDLYGKIALVERGSCGFAEKAAHIQANGVKAVIICNNEPGRRPMGPTDGINVSVPTVMISQQDCVHLLNVLEDANELNASLQALPVSLSNSVQVVWGDQAGQGQFDGGLNGWTVENCFVEVNGNTASPLSWQWYENPIEELFGSQMISYSRCNGAVGYDASYWNLNYGGDLGIPNGYPNHHCELISPAIDLSNAGPVSLQFWQTNFSLNGNDNPGDPVSRVFISYDGGMTWPDQINVETNNILTADQTVWANGELKRYFLPQLAGEPNIRLKFEFHGDFYAWYIDDVYFTAIPDNNLTINPDVYGLQPSARTPISLAEPVFAITEVTNSGRQAQPNTKVTVEYSGPSTTIAKELDLGTLQSTSAAYGCETNQIFSPDEIGHYAVTMTAHSDSMDFDMSDNSLDFSFELTDSIWSKDPGQVDGFVRPADVSHFTWGSVFTVPEDYQGTDMIYGVEFGFQLADSTDDLTEFIVWDISSWDNINNDRICQEAERETLIQDMVVFNYRDGVDNVMRTYDLEKNPILDPIRIETGKNYILAISWLNPDKDLNIFGYTDYRYLGMQVAYDSCSALQKYTDVIGIGDNTRGDWSTAGWSSGIVPAMRLITKPLTVSSVKENNTNVQLNVYPNPSTDKINIEVQFEKKQDQVEISIKDITGKTILVHNDYKVSNRLYSFNLNEQNSGMYFIEIKTESGMKSTKFLLHKSG